MAQPLYKELIADADVVQQRIDELARQVVERYKDKQPLFVCLLRGGAPFATRLMFAITKHDPYFWPELDYMTVKTYGASRDSSQTRLVMDLAPTTQVVDRPVVLLDDVLDKGLTADFAQRHLKAMKAGSVDLIVLVQKRRQRDLFPEATLYGFEAPEDWLTGMGLDDTRIALEAGRWADYVAIANDAA